MIFSSISMYSNAIIFLLISMKYYVHAGGGYKCDDTTDEFNIPLKGKWTCEKLREKRKISLCDTERNVKKKCKRTCGFCPCKNRKGKFKLMAGGEITKVKCNNEIAYCGKKKFSRLCPDRCNSCKRGSECLLSATFGHPFENPDDAPYFGYHADYLEVSYGGDDNNLCDADSAENSWCFYQNSIAGWNQAYVSNVDDYYDEKEWLSKETFLTSNMAGQTHTYRGYHIYQPQDYYNYDGTWSDHMMTAYLKITVANTGQVLDNDGNGGWGHPVDLDVFTHLETGDVNPDHKGYFAIDVTCDTNCVCSASNYDSGHYYQ